MQKKKECIKSKCRRFFVAGIDFGTTFSGYAFSNKSAWKSIYQKRNCFRSFLPYKDRTVLLLKPDKSFLAFGFEAVDIYSNLREDSTSDSDSPDSDSQDETEWRNYYYFHDFKMLLLNKNVSCLMFIFSKCVMHET